MDKDMDRKMWRKRESVEGVFSKWSVGLPTTLVLSALAVGANGLSSSLAAELPESAKEPGKTSGETEEQPASEHLLKGLAPWRENLSSKGVDFSLEYHGEGIANVSGGLRRAGLYEGLLKLGIDLDGEKLVGWKGGSFHVSAHYAHGQSPTAKLLGDVLTLSNLDAYDSVRLFEVWFQQEWWDGKFSIRAGQLAADEEFAGTEYGGLFMHGTTGWPGMIALNAPTPAYPAAAPGVRLEFKPTSYSFVRAGVFDGNPDPGDDAGHPVNGHGVRVNLSEGAFLIAEGGILWNQEVSTDQRTYPGTAKVGGWYHTDRFDDQRMDDTGLSLADPGTSGVAASHRGNWGMYGAVEQLVYRENAESVQGLGLFARVGASPSERSYLKYYVEGGLHYQGLIPGRDEDVFGIAASYGRVSGAVRGLAEDTNLVNATSDPLPDYEMAIQATYQIPVRPGWSLQPTVWWIMHPGGSSAVKNAVLLGLRSSFDF